MNLNQCVMNKRLSNNRALQLHPSTEHCFVCNPIRLTQTGGLCSIALDPAISYCQLVLIVMF